MFEDLFPSGRGRPSIAPDVVAAVIVLQTLHGLSDREAADAVTFDLRWKAACGVAVDAGSFHPSTLTYWRRRLAASQRPHRIFEVVRQLIVETGAVKGRNRRALDSTVLDDAVARQDTVTQLIAAVRRVARDVPGAAESSRPAAPATTTPRRGSRGSPGTTRRPASSWCRRWSTTRSRCSTGSTSTPSAPRAGSRPRRWRCWRWSPGKTWSPPRAPTAPTGGGGSPARTAPDRVISIVDPETRHAHKTTERRQDGFKAHVVVEPDTGLTTAAQLTKANGPDNSDATIGAGLLEDRQHPAGPRRAGRYRRRWRKADRRGRRQREDGSEQVEVLGDSAYGTGEMLDALDRTGRKATIKPWPTRPAVEGGFTIDDFGYDDQAGTLTCPNQVTRPLSTEADGHLRRGLPRLPAAGPVHHLSPRPQDHRPPPREAAAAPPTTRPRSRLPADLPTEAAAGRTHHRLAGPRQPASPLPRRRQEQRLAAAPPRWAQPSTPARPGSEPQPRNLAAGLNKDNTSLDPAAQPPHDGADRQGQLAVAPSSTDSTHAARPPLRIPARHHSPRPPDRTFSSAGS